MINVKGLVTLIVSTIMVTMGLGTLAYGNQSDTTVGDLYTQEITEVACIDGVEFSYHLHYNEEGYKTIDITSDNASQTDTLVYNTHDSTIYLNGDKLGYVKTRISTDGKASNSRAGYVYQYSFSNYVSWAAGTSVAVVAAAIAVPLAFMGPAGVIAAMGSAALSALSSSAIGGTVSGDLYQFLPASSPLYYQNIWRFKASTGATYGSFTSYITV